MKELDIDEPLIHITNFNKFLRNLEAEKNDKFNLREWYVAQKSWLAAINYIKDKQEKDLIIKQEDEFKDYLDKTKDRFIENIKLSDELDILGNGVLAGPTKG